MECICTEMQNIKFLEPISQAISIYYMSKYSFHSYSEFEQQTGGDTITLSNWKEIKIETKKNCRYKLTDEL